MKKIVILLLGIGCFEAYSQNTAKQYGDWNNCYTWDNAATIYNSSTGTAPNVNSKTIDNNVTVKLNLPLVYTNKITLNPGSKIELLGANKIAFSGSGSSISCSSTANKIDVVTVKFNESVSNVKSLSGFLQGLTQSNPTNTEINPLQPKLFRQWDKSLYQRCYNLAGRVHLLMSDNWAHSYGYNNLPKDNNEGLYEAQLNNFFAWAKQPDINNPSTKPGIVWECWNEPDYPKFWKPSQTIAVDVMDSHYPVLDQDGINWNNDFTYWPNARKQEFFATYKKFYQTLRNTNTGGMGSSALIAGPSIGRFSKEHLKEFFDYCLTNSLEVNVVTWHELVQNASEPIAAIRDHVDYVRTNFKDNPAYAALNIQSIEINEMVGPPYKNNPAALASYLGYLEKAEVDYAAKACWEDGSCEPDKCEACNSNTFNHLFTSYDETKSNWWVYKLYADGVSNRVKSYNQNNRSVVISNKIDFNPVGTASVPYAQVLFGFVDADKNANSTGTGSYSIKLENLDLDIAPTIIGYYKIYDNLVIKRIPDNNPYHSSNSVNDLSNQNEPLYGLEDLDTEVATITTNLGVVTLNLANAKDGYLYQIIVMAHNEY